MKKFARLDGEDVQINATLYLEQAADGRIEQGKLWRNPNKKTDKTGMCTIAVSLQSLYWSHLRCNVRYADDTSITAENENIYKYYNMARQ